MTPKDVKEIKPEEMSEEKRRVYEIFKDIEKVHLLANIVKQII